MKGSAKVLYLFAAVLFLFGSAGTTVAQDRERVVRTTSSSRPTNAPPPVVVNGPNASTPATPSRSSSRPTLTNSITVVSPEKQIVTKTSSSRATNMLAGRRLLYGSAVSQGIMSGIQKRLGIPYLYGSEGPDRYDCSGFVWAVFHDAGIEFTRTSARELWNASVPVTGDERYKFGTLVFMNRLGHMGIVADENGFYHASSSRGITYSKFEGYWKNRIVGFRRLPMPEKKTAEPTTIVLDDDK